MNYHIALCEDNEADAGYVSGLLQEWARMGGYRIMEESFPSAEAFLFRYAEKKDFDLLLLDIEMGGMDGVELAEKIRKDNREIQIIFVTGYPDFMEQGYDVAALHYLMKPIDKEKFFKVLDRAVSVSIAEQKRKFLLLPVGKEMLRIYPDEIIYAESQGHYLILHTKKERISGNGTDVLRLRMTMQEAVKLLGDDFFPCSRSFLVGLRYVCRITKKTVLMEDGAELPLGKGLYDAINLALIGYLRS